MTGEERSWLQRFIIWREKNVKEKRFILVLSFLVGIFYGICRIDIETVDTLDTKFSYREFRHNRG
jgi:hypothetical protein